ncbi:MAG TPA: carboxypeptidase-like regulatory domain-containing protein, partial [Anaerolineae bacterium]
WGLLDTYLATSQQLQHGTLRGSIQSNGVPLPGVTITVTTPTGAELPFTSDQSGQYVAWLQPGTYTLATAPFGFAPVTQNNLVVTVNETTIRDANLSPLPVGTIQGIVREATTGAAVPAATLWAVGTPITTTTDNSGRYTLSLPNGQYELLVRAPAYRLARATVSPVIGQAINYDFSLVAGPTILLVDSGQWYYQTYASYYKASLSALNYAYDRWTIRNPFSDVPALNNLASYDTVIWSSPLDSPGSIGANNVITDYLGLGGNLLISGQNVGSNDGFGFGTQVWWYRDLAANFLGKTEVTRTINGAAHTHFEGLTISLNGGTSAGNQEQVDVVEVRKNALTNAAFYYDDGTIGGLQASHCQPFHIVYLGFGLEGVNQVADRNAILERSFNTFQAPRQPSGARWLPEAIDDFAVPGNRLVYTITLQNLSETITDTFQLKLSGNDPPLKWPATLVTPTLTLGPCEQAQTVLTIDVPYNAPRDSIHHMQLAAVSGNTQASVIQLNVQHKTPGYILFVDDERWYDREIAFQAALDAMDLPYDVWEVGWNDHGRGSPPFHLLNAYDFILWHTGYDWFDPVTEAENNALTTYLNRGGRLFLSSQDFLYYHHSTALARGYLGVLDYHESITPTLVYGGRHPAVPGALAGPLPLDYGLYQNFSDGLIPASGSQVFWWHDQGMPAAIATATGWRSIFLGLPFETLPPQVQTNAMSSIVGWLSDLGDSTFTAGSRTVSVGRPLAYTLVLRNAEKGVTNRAAITNTLPAGLELVPGSLTGDAVYNSATRQITWQGTIRHNSSHQIRYQARPRATLSPGARLDNHVSIHYQRPHQQHSLSLTRTATVWVDAPDLTSSTLAAIASAPQAAENVTYTLSLHNNGLASTKDATAVVRLPDAFVPITDTLQTSAGLVTLANQRISWEGNLAPGDTVTVSLVLDSVVVPQILRLPATAVISDGITDTWLQDVQLTLVPYVSYFPLIANK